MSILKSSAIHPAYALIIDRLFMSRKMEDIAISRILNTFARQAQYLVLQVLKSSDDASDFIDIFTQRRVTPHLDIDNLIRVALMKSDIVSDVFKEAHTLLKNGDDPYLLDFHADFPDTKELFERDALIALNAYTESISKLISTADDDDTQARIVEDLKSNHKLTKDRLEKYKLRWYIDIPNLTPYFSK